MGERGRGTQRGKARETICSALSLFYPLCFLITLSLHFRFMMGCGHTHKHDAEQPVQLEYIKRDFMINIKLNRISMTDLASAGNDVHLWAGLHRWVLMAGITQRYQKKKRKNKSEEKRREEKAANRRIKMEGMDDLLLSSWNWDCLSETLLNSPISVKT